MQQQDLIDLIQKGIVKNSGGVWADFGSGDGAFTLALRALAGPQVQLYSIDKDESRLGVQKKAFATQFPGTQITFLNKDFTKPLDLPPLDGLLAANSIHFHKDQISVFQTLATYLKPGGTFLVVEYNADTGNIYVPYPFSFPSFEKIAVEAGLVNPQLVATTPSGMLDEMYAARAYKIKNTSSSIL